MGLRKYFIAVILPPPHLEKVEEIKNELHQRHNLRGALRSPAHITLHMPFEWREEKEEIILEALSRFRFAGAFPLKLDGFGFFEPRVIYVNVAPSEELMALQKELARHVRSSLGLLNASNETRGFHPHVTVASRDLKKPLYYGLAKEFAGRGFHATFECTGFSLLRLEKKWEELRFFAL